MANTLLSPQGVANILAAYLREDSTYLNTSNREYTKWFEGTPYPTGNTVQIPLDNRFIGSRGSIPTLENIDNQFIEATIGEDYNIMLEYQPQDLQRTNLRNFGEVVLRPIADRIQGMMNKEAYETLKLTANLSAGDPASALNTYNAINDANVVLNQLPVPKSYNRMAILSAKSAAELQGASTLQNNFTQTINKRITENATLGRIANIDCYQDAVNTTHVAGTASANNGITVKTAVSGGRSITLTGLTGSQNVKAGDVVNIAGVYEWNSTYRQGTSTLKTFIVQSDATQAAGDLTITIGETIQFTSNNKNIYADGGDTEIPAGAAVTVAASHEVNFVLTPRGLIMAMPKLLPFDTTESGVHVDPKSGVCLRVSKQGIIQGKKANALLVDGQAAITSAPLQVVRLMSAPAVA